MTSFFVVKGPCLSVLMMLVVELHSHEVRKFTLSVDELLVKLIIKHDGRKAKH